MRDEHVVRVFQENDLVRAEEQDCIVTPRDSHAASYLISTAHTMGLSGNHAVTGFEATASNPGDDEIPKKILGGDQSAVTVSS